MERSTWKRNRVDAFSINLDGLDGLCSQLQKRFGDSNSVHISIELKFPNEHLKFESVDDMKLNSIDYDKSTKFSLTMISSSKYFILKYPPHSNLGVSIESSSNDDAWCAGINETAISYLKKHRVWHHWIIHRFTWWSVGLIVLFLVIPNLYDFFNFFPITSQKMIDIFILQLLWLVFLLDQYHILPSGTIRIRQGNRNIKQILIIVGIFAAIVAAVSDIITIISNLWQ